MTVDIKTNSITGKILDSAIEVHRNLGPGLLESIYEECLEEELKSIGLRVKRQVNLPVVYKGKNLNSSFRIDLMVEENVIVELKATESNNELYTAQLLSYLRLANKQIGLLINFNVPKLIDGFKRIINPNFKKTPLL